MGRLSFLFSRRGRQANQAPPVRATESSMYRALRTLALQLSAANLPAPFRGREPVVVLMEIGSPQMVATLVAVADGTTSLYLSNGGGVIGAGEHKAVRAAASSFLERAAEQAPALFPVGSYPLPEPGRVRLYVKMHDCTLAAEAAEDDLGNGRHELSPLFLAGRNVIAVICQNAQKK